MADPLDPEPVWSYGRAHADFGGVYVDGAALVVMFTGNLDQHRLELEPLLRHPEWLRMELADRPYAAVEASNFRVQRLLMLDGRPYPDVVGIGIGMEAGQLVIHVQAENLTDELAAAIREAVAPDEVVVAHGTRMHRR